MKAIVYHQFGSTKNLKLTEVPTPSPKKDEVLVKVHTASVNSWDWDLVIGQPLVYRLLFGFFKPRYPIIGSDFSGTIEAVGKNVTQYKAGDEVYGDNSPSGFGTFAEYVCVPQKNLRHKPPQLSFENAAALPQAGLLAWQGLSGKKQIGKGDHVLINGAGGGVGTLALQLCKLWGAHVTAVDHTSKLERLKILGADAILDYTKTNYTQTGIRYDFILDSVGQYSVNAYFKALKPHGRLEVIGGKPALLLKIVLPKFRSREGKKVALLAHRANDDLEALTELVLNGSVKPIIDSSFPLEETPQAIQKLGEGKVFGKVIIKMI